MAIDPGTRTARFLQQGRSYESVVRYIARVGPSVHENVQSKLPMYFQRTRRRRGNYAFKLLCTVIAYRTPNGP